MLEALFSIGTFFIKAVKYAVPKMAAFMVRAVVNEVNATFGTSIPVPARQKIASIKRTNSELEELDRKKSRDKGLSKKDQDTYEELQAKRDQEAEEYRCTKQQEVAANANENAHDFVEAKLADGKTNLLQYHLGQAALGKPCPRCGSPMLLKQTANGNSFGDFFWSCRNFFRPEEDPLRCKTTFSFEPADVSLLYKDVPELQCSYDDLTVVTKQKVVQASLQKRVGNHLATEDEDILCPVYQTPMVLHERRGHNDNLVEMYRLDCPYLNCGQMVRLKSAAQVIALLRRKEGKGILD